MEWMILPLRRYADFSGRSRRKEYWMYVLFTMIAGAILGVLDSALGLDFDTGGGRYGDNGVLGSLFSLATLVPSIAVAVRRLHDTDRSGWWILLPVVVLVVGVIAALGMGANGGFDLAIGGSFLAAMLAALASVVVLVVFFCLEGTRGANRFGPDPKGGHQDLAEVFS